MWEVLPDPLMREDVLVSVFICLSRLGAMVTELLIDPHKQWHSVDSCLYNSPEQTEATVQRRWAASSVQAISWRNAADLSIDVDTWCHVVAFGWEGGGGEVVYLNEYRHLGRRATVGVSQTRENAARARDARGSRSRDLHRGSEACMRYSISTFGVVRA